MVEHGGRMTALPGRPAENFYGKGIDKRVRFCYNDYSKREEKSYGKDL